MEAILTIFCCICAYVAGSVNFSILLFRVLGKDDLRKHFSGNPGATNVRRQAGLFWAAVVLLLDVGRGVAVALLAMKLLPLSHVPWVGLGLLLGNRYPCFHRFKGGKGVGAYLGFTIPLAPMWLPAALVVYAVGVKVTRKPFVGSLLMVCLLALGTIFSIRAEPVGNIAVLASLMLIVYSHRTNFLGKQGGKPS